MNKKKHLKHMLNKARSVEELMEKTNEQFELEHFPITQGLMQLHKAERKYSRKVASSKRLGQTPGYY